MHPGVGLGPLGVPGEDQLESNITLVTAKHILREAWLPDVPDATWLEQVRPQLRSPSAPSAVFSP